MLLVDKLDSCKGKRNKYAKEHIKKIQNAYKQEDLVIKTAQIINKGKQQVQNEEILFYKPYNVDKPRSKTPEPTFIQDNIENLEKYMKYMQLLVKTMPFYPLSYYKSI